ncbi:MAG: MBL fold metallo-hydrolase [Bacteroidia bacterium]
MIVEQLYTNCLAEAAYYIESEGEAIIIDPIRETEPYLQKLEERKAKLKYVFETHFHADFVSGHIDLAKKTGATIVYGPKADTVYNTYSAKDGEEFQLGKIKIRVLHTPGHTLESTCYLLFDENGKDFCVFTGDTLFVGDVGRPDLLDGVMSKEELASMMYESLNNKLKPLADDVIVYPAHGPGSSCGKNIGKETWSTIGQQKQMNYYMREMDKDKFIDMLTTGLSTPPAYFFEDAKINKQGYDNVDEVVKRNLKSLSVADVKTAIANDAIVLDTREANDFEKGFIKGSINIGLNGQYAIWVGTLIHIEQPLVLITEKGKDHEAVMRLARVGFENIIGVLSGGIESWKAASEPLETIKSIEAEEIPAYCEKKSYCVIDVRKQGEWESGHLKNATLFPLSDLWADMDKLNKDEKYVIHCAGGYRSMTAASMMRSKGFNNVVNVYGGFSKIKTAGLPLEEEATV